MSKHVLYVGRFPQTTLDDQLRNLLWAYGAVSHVHVVRLKHPGESAGYGFVEMDSSEQASNADIALEGAILYSEDSNLNNKVMRKGHALWHCARTGVILLTYLFMSNAIIYEFTSHPMLRSDPELELTDKTLHRS